MTSEDQKRRERAALESIFPSAHYEAFDAEAPDFRVRPLAGRTSSVFGVEVTQLYDSDSSARLANNPSYIPNLLSGAAPIHKHDAHLARQEVTRVRGQDGSRRNIQAVVWEIPTGSEYVRLLVDIIRAKSEKHYATGLSFLDLIVEDKTSVLALVDHVRVVEFVLQAELIAGLGQSRFREIFLLTRSKEHRRIVVPLRASLLMQETLVFMRACQAIREEGWALPSAPAHEVIAEYCRRRGFAVGLVVGVEGYILAYGTLSVLLSESNESGFGIHEDHILPTVEVVVSDETLSSYEATFRKVEAWAAKHVVVVKPAILGDDGLSCELYRLERR